jgi:hypothetical protein
MGATNANPSTSGVFGVGGESDRYYGGSGGGGGGGGWYGGGGGSQNQNLAGSGAGGSSFISGLTGVTAINSDGTPSTGNPTHFSGLSFTEALMIAGNGEQWDGTSTTSATMPGKSGTDNPAGTGNDGHGAARITAIEYYFELLGEQQISLAQHETFSDPGFTAIANYTDASARVTTTGTVNTSTIGTYDITYTLDHPDYPTKTLTRTITVTKGAEFSFTGTEKVWTAPYDGFYTVQLWGASGGDSTNATPKQGGYGAYTEGRIPLRQGDKFYIHVGQSGDGRRAPTFGGGGAGVAEPHVNENGLSGGGATDIRITSG